MSAVLDELNAECPGCSATVANLFKHMKRCCPEKIERSADPEATRDLRKASSSDDWLEVAEVREAARAAISALQDPMQRRALELRFGFENGQRPCPTEVGKILGGSYAKNGQAAHCLIRNALRSIPLVADDASNLNVLYEDDDLIAVAKPPFLRTTPVHRFCGKSLVNMLVGYLKPEFAPPPYLIHRLDQNTSGVLLCAKTKDAAGAVTARWAGPDCSKEYLAIVHMSDASQGCSPGEVFTVDAPLSRATKLADNTTQEVNVDGRSAATRFEVLARSPSAGLLLCSLVESGRTHQIRVHAAHAGMPLLGDALYGGDACLEKVHVDRVALHAWRLRVLHPLNGKPLVITAPLPQDLLQCCVAHEIEWQP